MEFLAEDNFVRKQPDGTINCVWVFEHGAMMVALFPNGKMEFGFGSSLGISPLRKKLARLGYIELFEAKLRGIVPADWEPPPPPKGP